MLFEKKDMEHFFMNFMGDVIYFDKKIKLSKNLLLWT